MLFEGIVSVTIGFPSITEQEHTGGIGIMVVAEVVPPPAQIIGDKSRCFMVGANADMRPMSEMPKGMTMLETAKIYLLPVNERGL